MQRGSRENLLPSPQRTSYEGYRRAGVMYAKPATSQRNCDYREPDLSRYRIQTPKRT